jgi:hypothetical protein
MKATASGCALVGGGIIMIVVACLIVHEPAQKALWVTLVPIAGASVFMTLGALSILRELSSRSDPSK